MTKTFGQYTAAARKFNAAKRVRPAKPRRTRRTIVTKSTASKHGKPL